MKLHKHLSLIVGACLALAAVAPAHAVITVYNVNMSGPKEAPPNTSPAIGTATVTFDTVLNTMRLQATFSGLLGNTMAAHIHCCTVVPGTGTAGVATTTPSFVGFPLGVTSGSVDQIYDMTKDSSYNAAYITANGGTATSAFSALRSGVASGVAYLNIHTSSFAGGEIRGFLSPVPEASTWAMMGLGLVAVAGVARRRRT